MKHPITWNLKPGYYWLIKTAIDGTKTRRIGLLRDNGLWSLLGDTTQYLTAEIKWKFEIGKAVR